MKRPAAAVAGAAFLLIILAGWLLVFLGGVVAPLPFGLWPMLISACQDSPALMVLVVLGTLIFYLWLFLSLRWVSARQRRGTGSLLLLLALDLSLNIILTITTWWYLLGAGLDLVLLGLCLLVFRQGAGTGKVKK